MLDDHRDELRVLVGAPEPLGERDAGRELLAEDSSTPASIGVSMMPGAMVMTRMPYCARSRAAGTVMPTTPPFDAE